MFKNKVCGVTLCQFLSGIHITSCIFIENDSLLSILLYYYIIIDLPYPLANT